MTETQGLVSRVVFSPSKIQKAQRPKPVWSTLCQSSSSATWLVHLVAQNVLAKQSKINEVGGKQTGDVTNGRPPKEALSICQDPYPDRTCLETEDCQLLTGGVLGKRARGGNQQSEAAGTASPEVCSMPT